MKRQDHRAGGLGELDDTGAESISGATWAVGSDSDIPPGLNQSDEFQ